MFERRALRLRRSSLVRSPRGDGRPVLILPGLNGGDHAGHELRTILDELGHTTHSWGLGVNDNRPGILDEVEAVVLGFDEPVALVGISLGGVYARRIARRHPDRVRFVATLGSPHQRPFGRTPDRELPPTGVETLCVVARFDQYVEAQATTITGDPDVDVVRVVGGHCGLEYHPVVIRLLAERLAG